MPTFTIGNSSRTDISQGLGILALDTAVHAGIGAAAATIVSLNPIVGMTFGATYFAGSTAANFLDGWMDDKGINPLNNSSIGKVIKFALIFIAGIALATTACSFLGTTIAFSVGVKLTAAMFATTMIIATFVYNHSQANNVIVGQGLLSALRC